MPQGPANAVLLLEPTQPHGPSSLGGGGITSFCGWPDKARVISGSGPFGPIFMGVWHAWQSWLSTSRLPRASSFSPPSPNLAAGCCFAAGAAGLTDGEARCGKGDTSGGMGGGPFLGACALAAVARVAANVKAAAKVVACIMFRRLRKWVFSRNVT